MAAKRHGLPQRLHLGCGFTVRVVLLSPDELSSQLEGDEGSQGYWDIDRMTIAIRVGLGRRETRAAYAHEVVHAATDFARLAERGET